MKWLTIGKAEKSNKNTIMFYFFPLLCLVLLLFFNQASLAAEITIHLTVPGCGT
jgi:hypothetical protein